MRTEQGAEGSIDPKLNDRTGFLVVEMAARKLAELDPEFRDADAAWDAFIEWIGPDQREYVRAVRRTRHSVFYYMTVRFYQFAEERLGVDDFTLECGRAFAETVFEDNLYRLIMVAFGHEGAFQEAVVTVLSSYLHRYTASRYVVEPDMQPGETVLEIRLRDPKLGARYMECYGLDPVRAFRNSFMYIAGAIEVLVARIVKNVNMEGFRIEPFEERGLLHLPICGTDRFNFEAISEKLIDYIQRLDARSSEAAADERLESDLILDSELMRRTWDRVGRASRSDELVLLRGESGTGKSFIARKIHGLSARRERPFIEVCLASEVGSDNMVQSDLFGHERGAFTGAGAEKKGLFQLADGGTIFLDEIGDASPELQAKLLRVVESSTFKRLGGVQDITVDVRVIAATNRDLERMIEEGAFRRDLYYRLNVISLELPPLRERPEDVAALAQFLLARAVKGRPSAPVLGGGLARSLARYGWPGNIRELDHAMKHAAAMAEGGAITPADLPQPVRDALEATGEPGDSAGGRLEPGRVAGAGAIVDTEALRRAVRSFSGTPEIEGAATFDVPAHVDHAKREWLGVLIDELDGDLGRIGRLWDRGSEKTLRNLIRTYGLVDRLRAARARRGAGG